VGPEWAPANFVRGCELNPPAHAFSWQHRPGRPPPASGVPTYQEVSCPRFMRMHNSGGGNSVCAHGTQVAGGHVIVAIVPPALSQSDVASKDIHQQVEDHKVLPRRACSTTAGIGKADGGCVRAHRPTGALGEHHALGRRRLRPKPAEYRPALPKAVSRVQLVLDAVDREC